jgi:hypothetical protein
MYSDGNGSYSVYQLWSLTRDLPVVEIKTSKLRFNLEETEWEVSDDTDQVEHLLVKEIIKNLQKHPEHAERIQEANLDYPILVTAEMFVVDGMHRLCRALLEKRRLVKSRVVPRSLLEQTRVSEGTSYRHSI